jgi:hypothetical protein
MVGRTANHNFDGARRDFPEHIPIKQHKIDRPNRQGHRFRLPRIERHALESSKLPNRKRDRSVFFMEIHLNGFRAGQLAHVLDIRRNLGRATL